MTELCHVFSPYLLSYWVLDSAKREEEGWSPCPGGNRCSNWELQDRVVGTRCRSALGTWRGRKALVPLSGDGGWSGMGGGLIAEELLLWRVKGGACQVASRTPALKWGQ